MCRHTFTSATVGITQVSLAQKAIGSKPIHCRRMLKMPSWVSRIHRNTIAATTFETR